MLESQTYFCWADVLIGTLLKNTKTVMLLKLIGIIIPEYNPKITAS
jgi:hypothetical protein